MTVKSLLVFSSSFIVGCLMLIFHATCFRTSCRYIYFPVKHFGDKKMTKLPLAKNKVDMDSLLNYANQMDKEDIKKKQSKKKSKGVQPPQSTNTKDSKDKGMRTNKSVTTTTSIAESSTNTRFILGNGVEAITTTNLLQLVRSTAPYIFLRNPIPTDWQRPHTTLAEGSIDGTAALIIEDEDEDEDAAEEEDVGYFDNSGETLPSLSHSRGIGPWDLTAEGRHGDFQTPQLPSSHSHSAAQATTLAPIPRSRSLYAVVTEDAVQSGEEASSWRLVLRTAFTSKSRYTTELSTEPPTPAQRIDYFTLCLASHFATVATYVPTDVDSKIRGHCWADPDPEVLRAQFEILKLALKWDVTAVSTKVLLLDNLYPEPFVDPQADRSHNEMGSTLAVLSGHSGEFLSVLCGAMCAFIRAGNRSLATEAEALIHAELSREARIFMDLESAVRAGSKGSETKLLKAASIVTHNVGDVDQGLSYTDGNIAGLTVSGGGGVTSSSSSWLDSSSSKRAEHTVSFTVDSITVSERESAAISLDAVRKRFSRLAHEGFERYGGVFGRAKRLYAELLSAEGHRHYPLREARSLRLHPDLMLPLGPWLEQWGRLVASHAGLSLDQRVGVVRQLLRGCDSRSRAWCVPNQAGYYRALHGFHSVMPLDRLAKEKLLDKECRDLLATHEIRAHLSLSEAAFEGRLAKRVRELLIEEA